MGTCQILVISFKVVSLFMCLSLVVTAFEGGQAFFCLWGLSNRVIRVCSATYSLPTTNVKERCAHKMGSRKQSYDDNRDSGYSGEDSWTSWYFYLWRSLRSHKVYKCKNVVVVVVLSSPLLLLLHFTNTVPGGAYLEF